MYIQPMEICNDSRFMLLWEDEYLISI